MNQATLLVCHGTGVRNKSFEGMLDLLRSQIEAFHVPCTIRACLWGDALGIDFEGLSLPGSPQLSPAEEEQELRWRYLEVDPLFELRLWCTPVAPNPEHVFGMKTAGESLWTEVIEPYLGSAAAQLELSALLSRYAIAPLFQPAWKLVVETGLPERALTAADDEASEVARAFAEAVVAQMVHDAAASSPPFVISANLAEKLVERLLYDWLKQPKGVFKSLILRVFGEATRAVVRPLRSDSSRAIAPAIGDVLRYQAIGAQIRSLIRAEVEALAGPVFVLGHSLGGIACFEMMVESSGSLQSALPQVNGLITAGSQAPLLYEFDALQSVRLANPRLKDPLPERFPPWLNLYDENDLLSYRAGRLFPRAEDVQVDSMMPPLQAHSAYWTLDKTWDSIRSFMAAHHG